MARSKFYYTLCIFEGDSWGPQFGDYDRDVVVSEDDGWSAQFPKRHRKIICTIAGQRFIDAAVAKLNRKG